MGALALTYKQQYKTPFSPMIGGAKMVKWLDFDAVAEAVQKVGVFMKAAALFHMKVAVSFLAILIIVHSFLEASSTLSYAPLLEPLMSVQHPTEICLCQISVGC